MIAAFAQVNGVDLRQENHGALQRLAEAGDEEVDDEETFEEDRRGPGMTDLKVDNKYAWLQGYCALYRCRPKMLEAKDREPFSSFPPRRRSDAGVQPRGEVEGVAGSRHRPGATRPSTLADQASQQAPHPDPCATDAGGRNRQHHGEGKTAGRPAFLEALQGAERLGPT